MKKGSAGLVIGAIVAVGVAAWLFMSMQKAEGEPPVNGVDLINRGTVNYLEILPHGTDKHKILFYNQKDNVIFTRFYFTEDPVQQHGKYMLDIMFTQNQINQLQHDNGYQQIFNLFGV